MGKFCTYVVLLFVLLSLATRAGATHLADSVSQERAVDYYYLQALSYVEQEKYDVAFDMLEHCRALSPESSSVMFELVDMYQYLGKKSEALEMLKNIVRKDKKNMLFWQSLVQYFDNESDKETALKVCEEMARAFPDKSDIYLALAARYAELAMYSQAVEALEKYEKIEGRSEYVSLQKYRIYVILQQKDSALAELRALSAEYPDDIRFLIMEGDTYLMFNENEKALSLYNEVLEKSPDNVQVQLSMIDYYSGIKNDTMFVSTVEKLLKNDKLDSEIRESVLLDYIVYKERAGSSDYLINLFDELMELPFGVVQSGTLYVRYLLHIDKGEEAVAPVLDKILSVEPDNMSARLQQLLYAVERNNYEEIIARCDTAIMYFPDLLELYRYKGLASYLTGRKEEALKVYREGLEKYSQETESGVVSDVYALLGDTYHELGYIEESMKAYDSALEYDGSNISVLNNYAYYLALEERDLERALGMSYRTLQQEPDEAIYIDTYAWLLFLLGRYDEAKEYADKLLSIEGEKSAVEFHHCGDIYAKYGDIERAVECWVKARELGDDSKSLKRKIKKRKYIYDGKKK